MQVTGLISATAQPISEPQAKPETTVDGLGFDDFLDVINPLQHLPVVGMLYRAITGDEISAPAKIAGDTLFGGIYGFLGALGSVAYEGIAGESIEKTVLSLFDGSPSPAPSVAQRVYQAAQSIGLDDIERRPFYGAAANTVAVADLSL
jgi:hypothetical protein